ncbi:hypothetical protein ACSF6R_02140 [Escherichia coli]|uniref:hypothetical protein n=1 Tax=Escherichia coli TaxID=562 RepID=UPI003EEDD61D
MACSSNAKWPQQAFGQGDAKTAKLLTQGMQAKTGYREWAGVWWKAILFNQQQGRRRRFGGARSQRNSHPLDGSTSGGGATDVGWPAASAETWQIDEQPGMPSQQREEARQGNVVNEHGQVKIPDDFFDSFSTELIINFFFDAGQEQSKPQRLSSQYHHMMQKN